MKGDGKEGETGGGRQKGSRGMGRGGRVMVGEEAATPGGGNG